MDSNTQPPLSDSGVRMDPGTQKGVGESSYPPGYAQGCGAGEGIREGPPLQAPQSDRETVREIKSQLICSIRLFDAVAYDHMNLLGGTEQPATFHHMRFRSATGEVRSITLIGGAG